MAANLYDLFPGAQPPVMQSRTQAAIDALVAQRCTSLDAAEAYIDEIQTEVDTCEYQLAAPFGYFETLGERAAVLQRRHSANEMMPHAEAAAKRLRAEKVAEMRADVNKLEEQIREHIRHLTSRIEMGKKEEAARDAMVSWLEEEVEKLEGKIHALEHHDGYQEGCEDCDALKQDAERHAAYQAKRDADGVDDDGFWRPI